MRAPGAEALLEAPAAGRVHRSDRLVRFGDTSPKGRLRLDALARYLQDAAADDAVDAGIDDPFPWVVRRAVVEVHAPAAAGERLTLATWCSGTGSHWAERRVSVTGDRGAHLETVALWVHVHPRSGRPAPLVPGFDEVYGAAAAGRRVTARLRHVGAVPDGTSCRPWALRFVDFDVLGHVNNAAAWAVVEEVLADVDEGPSWPRRVEVEFREPILRADEVSVHHVGPTSPGGEVSLWVDATSPGGPATVRTTARATRLPTPTDDPGRRLPSWPPP
ncbi:MAG: thioesterase [Acidimicrobiales bacterium]